MLRILIATASLLLQLQAMPALAAGAAPDAAADAAQRTMAQNARVELPAPPAQQDTPPAPPLRHFTRYGR